MVELLLGAIQTMAVTAPQCKTSFGTFSRFRLLVVLFAAITSDGGVVSWGDGIWGGDSTAVQDQLENISQIQASGSAFAAITSDGRVVTWGDQDYGGDSTEVQDRLRDVSQIQASEWAFAAITLDGRVVTWGHPDYGGDSTAVQDQLRNVQQIQASRRAFCSDHFRWRSCFLGRWNLGR